MNKTLDYIEQFLDLSIQFVEAYKNVDTKYQTYTTLLSRADKATQDVLHKLELDTLSQSEKAKLATKLTNIRKDRRYYKDKVEALGVIVEKFESWGQSFGGCVNKLGNIAGTTKKSYQNRVYRKYTPRVITEITINSQKERK